MPTTLNLPQFYKRADNLINGGYSRNVNCFGIVPYLHNIQDNPIYLYGKSLDVYLSEFCKRVDTQDVGIGGIYVFCNDDTREHAIVRHSRGKLVHKVGIYRGCEYIIDDKWDADTYMKDNHFDSVEFYMCNLPCVGDDDGNVYVHTDHPHYELILNIKKDIDDFLSNQCIYSDKNVDPHRYIRDTTPEQMKEMYSYFNLVQRYFIATVLEDKKRPDSMDMWCDTFSLLGVPEVLKAHEDKIEREEK